MESGNEDMDMCPVCTEEMDSTDRRFQPCQCGYQVKFSRALWGHAGNVGGIVNTDGQAICSRYRNSGDCISIYIIMCCALAVNPESHFSTRFRDWNFLVTYNLTWEIGNEKKTRDSTTSSSIIITRKQIGPCSQGSRFFRDGLYHRSCLMSLTKSWSQICKIHMI